MWHWLLLVLPVIGPLRRRRATARVAHSLGALLAHGVELPIALAHAARATDDLELAARLADVRSLVLHGGLLSRALESTKAVEPPAIESVRAAERRGDVASVIVHIAQIETHRVDETARRAARILEPVLFVTFISMAMLVAAMLARD